MDFTPRLRVGGAFVDKAMSRFDTRRVMSLDLNELLRDWPHEPGMIKVRKILGTDGKEKLQLRIDLGLIQMETTGRPDGQEPHECESLLEFHQGKAKRATKKGQAYQLSAEDVGDLQQEGIQYYHRYISFFQLNDYQSVIRDTQRNLDMFAFVAKHAEREELAASVEQFTPYVLMMNTRARASIELEREDFPAAIQKIEHGMDRIRAFYDENENAGSAANSPELGFLSEWLEEVRGKQPLTKLQKMQNEMDKAIAAEAYEKAAELRDAIKAMSMRKQ
jgi:UvrB/uvrC motif